MKNIGLLLLLLAMLRGLAQEKCRDQFNFYMDTNARKAQPYTHLQLNGDPCRFQFAIVTDRTGGHRPGVFMDGVNKLNLLQPEFVMSVGDLIEGYTLDTTELNRQWNEFESFVAQLEMPFFYLPGNHDITNQIMEKIWKRRFGRTYYHFTYKDVLFLCLNSEDQRRGAGRGTISDPQFEYVRKVLAQHTGVKWTLIFMHQPLWHQDDTRRWRDLEKLLQDRSHTVFAGHEHRYVKERRNNGKYFTLATTGGGSSLRGPDLGEFDHVMWVTMTNHGPVMANLLLNGIWGEDVVTSKTKTIINKLSENPPLQIEPLIVNGKRFKAGESRLKMVNNEDIPMQISLSASNSANLGLFLESPEFTIPPNSVEFTTLKYRTVTSASANVPVTLQAEVTLAPPGEPAKVTYPFRYRLQPLPKYQLQRSKSPVHIDAALDDWKELEYSFVRDSGKVKVNFDLKYDEGYLYMAARVEDDTVISNGREAAWRQDNVAFGFNAEKSSISAMSVGRDWYSDEFLQLVTPAHDTTPSSLYRDMPEGSAVKCVKTEYGYSAELKVPLSYIESRQGENWQSIRVNVGIDDRDGDGNVSRFSWKPTWRSDENIVGSGLFWR